MRKIYVVVAIALLALGTYAQGFPWGDFKERKIKDIVAITTRAFRPDDSMFLAANLLATRAEVTFTGKSRPVPAGRKALINTWAGVYGYGKDYADRYENEYLYKEGADEYWIPTQTPVTKYFDKELKPNDKMILFLISAGAIRGDTRGKVDCVLLVEEYQLPQNMEKVPKPPPG